jgi:uncharacterized delta-60 repeat protein
MKSSVIGFVGVFVLGVFEIALLSPVSFGVQAQTLNWDYRYNGPGQLSNCDIGKSVCLGPDGNIYCTGQASVSSSAGYSDMVVICLSPEGTAQWTYLYNAGGSDMGYSVTAGPDGNLYVAGTSSRSKGNPDFAILSLTSAGSLRWVYTYDPTGDFDFANSIVVGTDGNIYACGQSTVDPAHGADATVVSLTPEGTERWTHHYNGSRNGSDIAWNITAGGDGNVYIAGRLYEHPSGDFAVASLSPDGEERWAYLYNGSANGEDEAQMVIFGGDGNIYAVGRADELGRSRDLVVVSLTSSGQQRWFYEYNGPRNMHDVGLCLSWGTDGNIYVGGKTLEADGDAFTIISLTPSGAERWRYLPVWGGYNGVWSITTDDQANVYGCGWIGQHLPYSPYYQLALGVASVTSGGQERWAYSYSGTDSISGLADQVIWGGDSAVYVVGFSMDIQWEAEFTVLSFSTGGTGQVYLGCQALTPVVCRGKNFYLKLVVTNDTGEEVSGILTFSGYSGYDCDPGGVLVSIPRDRSYPPGTTEQYYFLKVPSAVVPGQYSVSVSGSLGGHELFCCVNTEIMQCEPWRAGDAGIWELEQVDRPEVALPTSTALHQNHPNPFNAETNISFSLAEPDAVRLQVYDLAGRLVETLFDGHQEAGEHVVTWDASAVSSGLYFYRLTAGDYTESKRMMLVK